MGDLFWVYNIVHSYATAECKDTLGQCVSARVCADLQGPKTRSNRGTPDPRLNVF